MVELKQNEEENDETAEDENKNVIIVDSESLLLSFAEDMPKTPLNILKNNGVCVTGLLEYYDLLDEIYGINEVESADEEDDTNSEKIPKALSDFVTICPDSLKNNTVIQLNVNSSIAGTTYRGMAEERFKLLIEYLEKHENVILFIDEIHMAIGAGEVSSKGENDMSNALKPFLASSKAKVIGATTEEEYDKIISRDSAFKRRFKKVIVKEPKSKEVYPMLKNAIKAHEKFHGVTISKEMVEYAVLISACFNNTTRNPDRTNDLIDTSMVIAKEKGLKEVTRECILENFDINFEKYEKMDINAKKSTAYHEAGHYLVWKLSSDILKNQKGIAISIMPAEGNLGVTVYDDLSDEVTICPNHEYFIASLASTLGGRIAEELYTSDINSGASADLEYANKKAYDIVCNYAMTSKDHYSTYIEENNYHMLNEKTIDTINQEKAELLKEAYAFAKNLLTSNKDLLEKLVNVLLEKGILDENDLNEIFNNNQI